MKNSTMFLAVFAAATLLGAFVLVATSPSSWGGGLVYLLVALTIAWALALAGLINEATTAHRTAVADVQAAAATFQAVKFTTEPAFRADKYPVSAAEQCRRAAREYEITEAERIDALLAEYDNHD